MKQAADHARLQRRFHRFHFFAAQALHFDAKAIQHGGMMTFVVGLLFRGAIDV
jgi:hypothetical protein